MRGRNPEGVRDEVVDASRASGGEKKDMKVCKQNSVLLVLQCYVFGSCQCYYKYYKCARRGVIWRL